MFGSSLRNDSLIIKMSTTGENGPTCELMGPISLVLQSFLGLIAVMSLLVKRSYENPRRPWRVWCFDVSKQVIGALLLHFLNVLASIMYSDDVPELDDNPCTWYFLNVLFDTTIGVPILWFILWNVYLIAYHFKMQDIMSGEYGDPPQTKAFMKQLFLYLLAVILSKIFLAVVLYAVPFLDDWGAWLISWSDYDIRIQIIFVMLIFPTFMNSIQYYVVDSIIQSPNFGVASTAMSIDMRARARRYATLNKLRRLSGGLAPFS